MGEVQTLNFLRMYDKRGNAVRDFTIKPGVNPIETADFMFDRNEGVAFIEFITMDIEKGRENHAVQNVLASVNRENLQDLRAAGFAFKADTDQDETEEVLPHIPDIERVKGPGEDKWAKQIKKEEVQGMNLIQEEKQAQPGESGQKGKGAAKVGDAQTIDVMESAQTIDVQQVQQQFLFRLMQDEKHKELTMLEAKKLVDMVGDSVLAAVGGLIK